MKRTRSQVNSRNKIAGTQVEHVFANQLRALGCDRVETIPDTWIPIRRVSGREYVCMKGGRKLDGDIRGFFRGTPVLVECKMRKGALPWSALSAHQHEALTYYHAHGMLALVGWYDEAGGWHLFPHFAMRGPRTSMDANLADRVCLRSRGDMNRLRDTVLL